MSILPSRGNPDSGNIAVMRKPRRILLLVAVALLAVVVVVALNRSREPSYNGIKLREWVRMYDPSNSNPNRDQADNAVLHIRTNAIPYLLKWISYDQPAWKARWYPRLIRLLTQVHQDWVVTDEQERLADSATKALRVLGPQAAGAVPDLGRLMNAPEANRSAERATHALWYIGEAAFPTLLAGLTNQQTSVRLTAAEGIRYIIGKGGSLGTNGPLAASGLIQCLKHADEGLSLTAVRALATLTTLPDLAVPLLTDCLQDSRQYVPREAAVALADFGEKARVAVPALLSLLTNRYSGTRQAAADALLKIAPELLDNPPPVTTPPPP